MYNTNTYCLFSFLTGYTFTPFQIPSDHLENYRILQYLDVLVACVKFDTIYSGSA